MDKKYNVEGDILGEIVDDEVDYEPLKKTRTKNSILHLAAVLERSKRVQDRPEFKVRKDIGEYATLYYLGYTERRMLPGTGDRAGMMDIVFPPAREEEHSLLEALLPQRSDIRLFKLALQYSRQIQRRPEQLAHGQDYQSLAQHTIYAELAAEKLIEFFPFLGKDTSRIEKLEDIQRRIVRYWLLSRIENAGTYNALLEIEKQKELTESTLFNQTYEKVFSKLKPLVNLAAMHNVKTTDKRHQNTERTLARVFGDHLTLYEQSACFIELAPFLYSEFPRGLAEILPKSKLLSQLLEEEAIHVKELHGYAGLWNTLLTEYYRQTHPKSVQMERKFGEIISRHNLRIGLEVFLETNINKTGEVTFCGHCDRNVIQFSSTNKYHFNGNERIFTSLPFELFPSLSKNGYTSLCQMAEFELSPQDFGIFEKIREEKEKGWKNIASVKTPRPHIDLTKRYLSTVFGKEIPDYGNKDTLPLLAPEKKTDVNLPLDVEKVQTPFGDDTDEEDEVPF